MHNKTMHKRFGAVYKPTTLQQLNIKFPVKDTRGERLFNEYINELKITTFVMKAHPNTLIAVARNKNRQIWYAYYDI